MPELKANPMWSCWCITDGGCRAYSHTVIACPDCGRLQPPKNVTKIIHRVGPDLRHIIKAPSPRQCLPNPEDKKLLDL